MIGAVVLAAGESRRLGRPKQLVHFRGEALVRGAARAVLEGGCRPVVVVLGCEAATVRAELAGLVVDPVLHAAWKSAGIGGSIRVGVRRLLEQEPHVQAAIVATVDQYLIEAPVVRGLRSRFDGAPGTIVASAYADTCGVPALFGRGLFDELQRLPPGHGARSLILDPASRVIAVDWPDGEIDLDRPDQLPAGR